ncbi:hypothetical protein [Mesorhizobium sp. M1396]
MPHSVLNAPINTVREGLIDDMTLRRFSQEIQRARAIHGWTDLA